MGCFINEITNACVCNGTIFFRIWMVYLWPALMVYRMQMLWNRMSFQLIRTFSAPSCLNNIASSLATEIGNLHWSTVSRISFVVITDDGQLGMCMGMGEKHKVECGQPQCPAKAVVWYTVYISARLDFIVHWMPYSWNAVLHCRQCPLESVLWPIKSTKYPLFSKQYCTSWKCV